MRYCPTCDDEYVDSVERCRDDGAPLLARDEWEAELRRQGRSLEPGMLVTVAIVSDRFEADQLAAALADEELRPSVVATKASVVDPLTTPGPTTYAVVVPEDEEARALALVPELREALESSTVEAGEAAEAEEAEGERAAATPV